jgi:hypothetical protein
MTEIIYEYDKQAIDLIEITFRSEKLQEVLNVEVSDEITDCKFCGDGIVKIISRMDYFNSINSHVLIELALDKYLKDRIFNSIKMEDYYNYRDYVFDIAEISDCEIFYKNNVYDFNDKLKTLTLNEKKTQDRKFDYYYSRFF